MSSFFLYWSIWHFCSPLILNIFSSSNQIHKSSIDAKNVKLQQMWKKAGKLRQDNLFLYQLKKRFLHRLRNRESTKKDKTVNASTVTALMDIIVVAITMEQTCSIMDCKDEGRDRSKHCLWDNGLKGVETEISGPKELFSQLFLLLPWQFELPKFTLESRTQWHTNSYPDHPDGSEVFTIVGMWWNQVFLLNFY